MNSSKGARTQNILEMLPYMEYANINIWLTFQVLMVISYVKKLNRLI